MESLEMQSPEVDERREERESNKHHEDKEWWQERLDEANDFLVVNRMIESIDERNESLDSETRRELQENFKEVMEIDREKWEIFLWWFAELDTQPEYINQFLNK